MLDAESFHKHSYSEEVYEKYQLQCDAENINLYLNFNVLQKKSEMK